MTEIQYSQENRLFHCDWPESWLQELVPATARGNLGPPFLPIEHFDLGIRGKRIAGSARFRRSSNRNRPATINKRPRRNGSSPFRKRTRPTRSVTFDDARGAFIASPAVRRGKAVATEGNSIRNPGDTRAAAFGADCNELTSVRRAFTSLLHSVARSRHVSNPAPQ